MKRLLTISILLLLVAFSWAFFNGYTINDIGQFLSNALPIEDDNISSNPDSFSKTSDSQEKHDSSYSTTGTADAFQPVPTNPFQLIDNHARNVPPQAEKQIGSLAQFLGQVAKNDIEKARVIYVWLTDNIVYDDLAYNTGRYENNTADDVLQSRSSVCEGFSNLFVSLGNEIGLDVIKIPGYSKGFGYRPGSRFKRADHAWNGIQINGEWRIFDATWGQGNGKAVNGKLVSVKEFDDYWFNLDPHEAIFSHYPEDPNYAFIEPLITLREYERFPKIQKSYFDLGFDGKTTFESAYQDPSLSIPLCYHVDTYVKVIDSPPTAQLNLDESYMFEFFIPRGESVAIIDAQKNWTYLERKYGRFSLNYIPNTPGELHISTKHESGGKSFHTILKYTVSKTRSNI